MGRDERKPGLEPTLADDSAHEASGSWGDALGSDPSALVADRYELLGLVGSGGMGNVYRVHDRELDEEVALKFLHRRLMEAPGMLERFRQEVKLARRVTHPNVARTFDIGEHGGQRFLTMEFVDGQSLGAAIRRAGALPADRVVAIGLALCAALSAAHAAGVVHRDLKPDNVLIERGGRVVITDFGIACALASGSDGRVVGTAAYMAPEQLRGDAHVDGRADLYALGVLLFEALLGRRAWPAEELLALAQRKLSEPPPDPLRWKPELDPALAELLRRCMASDPEHRPPGAEALAAALAPLRASSPSPPSTARPEAPTRAADTPTLGPPRVERGDRRVAVLPFRNAGPSEDDHVADELTDDLIDSLSMARGLKLRPRRMITAELADSSDLAAIGRALDVQVVVEGVVRRRGGAVRVSARASSTAEGLQLWAKRFDAPANELLAINDRVARAVIAALAGELELPVRRAPTDPEAIDLLVRARQALRHAWMGHGGLDRAVELFAAGLERAPEDAALLSGYAMALARKLNYGDGEAGELEDQARRAAAAAIERAPQAGESWLALASLRYTTSDWVGAVAALRAAIERVPSLQKAHEMLVSIEAEVGEIEAALARARAILALDPGSAVTRDDLTRLLALLGRFEESDAVAAGHGPDPTSDIAQLVGAARLALWRGRPQPQSRSPQLAHNPTARDHLAAYAHAAAGRPLPEDLLARWEQRIAATRPGSRFRPLMLQFLTELHAAGGQPQRALAALDRAVEAGLHDLVWLERCPALAGVREHPAFAAARARVAGRVAAIRAALHPRDQPTPPGP